MVLGFKRFLDKKKIQPTYFRERILAGVDGYPLTVLLNPDKSRIELRPKLHTFRADPHDRWKAGRKIEMVYRGAGYKIIDHFNKCIPELEKCVSVQRIRISNIVPAPDHSKRIYTDPEAYFPLIEIDGKSINYTERDGSYGYCKELTLKLINNDGFDSITDFCKWFGYKTDKKSGRRITPVFEGKIIHWTNHRY